MASRPGGAVTENKALVKQVNPGAKAGSGLREELSGHQDSLIFIPVLVHFSLLALGLFFPRSLQSWL